MKVFSKKDNDDFIEIENETVTKAPPPENPNVLTVEEVLGKDTHKASNTKSTGALDALKKRMLTANGTIQEKPQKSEGEKTLLQKCRPYIIDDKGEDTSKDIPPAYKLESVADILKKEKTSAVDNFNQKYDFEADYLGKYVEQKLAEEKEERYEEVIKAYKKYEKLKNEYVDDYGYFTFETKDKKNGAYTWCLKSRNLF